MPPFSAILRLRVSPLFTPDCCCLTIPRPRRHDFRLSRHFAADVDAAADFVMLRAARVSATQTLAMARSACFSRRARAMPLFAMRCVLIVVTTTAFMPPAAAFARLFFLQFATFTTTPAARRHFRRLLPA